MNGKVMAFAAGLIFLTMVSCSVSFLGTPPPFPTSPFLPSSTPLGFTPVAASATPPGVAPTEASATIQAPSATTGVTSVTPTPGSNPVATVTGTPSGPYAVIRITPPDGLAIRSGPDPSASIVGAFSASAATVMRTGATAGSGNDLWVEVQNPGGGTGWVAMRYLTESVTSAAFCADRQVNTLLTNLGHALTTADGAQLASLVSPVHGMDVRLYRSSSPVNYDPAHAAYVFTSTYAIDWGPAPGSGQETVGPFHVAVLPALQDVFNASYTLSCDRVQTGGASYDTSWPAQYASLNFYSIYKPGPSGDELNWRTILVGVDYVSGQPYVFSLTQLAWEP